MYTVIKLYYYFEKMFKLIEDKTKFDCLEDDPTIERESKLKDFLKRHHISAIL